MGALNRWWGRLHPRERRALTVLAVAVPLILGWWGVTQPWLERREALRRSMAALARQANDLQPLLIQARQLQARLRKPEDRTSEAVFARLEALLAGLPASLPRPVIHRREQSLGQQRAVLADLRFRGLGVEALWPLLEVIASSGLLVAGFELGIESGGAGFAGGLVLWQPEAASAGPSW